MIHAVRLEHEDINEYQIDIQRVQYYLYILLLHRGWREVAMFVLNAQRYARETTYHVRSEKGNGPRERVG
jgi:hypothetical protein